jgi:antitoxin ParD1/3/4
MAKNTSVILGDHFEAFIAEQLEGGQYTNASEVVREALRYMETQKKKEKALLEALDAGLASKRAKPGVFARVRAAATKKPSRRA